MSPLGIAIVGCGQIADAHLQQIARTRGGRAVAVCDTEPELTEQAADRFDVPQRFTDYGGLLRESSVDVVHLCTPVRSHVPLALQALEAGKHVYVEKPLAVDAAEAEPLIAAAKRQKRGLCLGHDQLFDPVWLRTRRLVADGRIGRVVHVESVLGYPVGGAFGREVAADADHWVRSLPGQLFQNTLSHPLYRITDLVPGELAVHAHAMHRSPQLDLPTELRVQLHPADGDAERATGSVLFLSQAKPPQRLTRLYGTAGGLEVDFDAQTIRRTPGRSLPGAFEKLQRPLGHLTEAAGNLARASWSFLKGDIHYFAGMKNLFEAFYEHLQTGSPPPIALDEMLRVTRLMDAVFAAAAEQHAPSSDTPGSRIESHLNTEVAP